LKTETQIWPETLAQKSPLAIQIAKKGFYTLEEMDYPRKEIDYPRQFDLMNEALAPDFPAPAYHKGQFTSVKLSDYLGKSIVLCYYPVDFTFV
jgi:hypothetical protein